MCQREEDKEWTAVDQILILSIYPYQTGRRGRFPLLYCRLHFQGPECWWQKNTYCQRFLHSLQTSRLRLDRLHVRFRFCRKNFCLPMKNFPTKICRWILLRHLHFQGRSQNDCCGELLKVPPALSGKFPVLLAASMRQYLRLQSHFHIRFCGYNPEWQINRSAGL